MIQLNGRLRYFNVNKWIQKDAKVSQNFKKLQKVNFIQSNQCNKLIIINFTLYVDFYA